MIWPQSIALVREQDGSALVNIAPTLLQLWPNRHEIVALCRSSRALAVGATSISSDWFLQLPPAEFPFA
jgi:hypothetical protein